MPFIKKEEKSRLTVIGLSRVGRWLLVFVWQRVIGLCWLGKRGLVVGLCFFSIYTPIHIFTLIIRMEPVFSVCGSHSFYEYECVNKCVNGCGVRIFLFCFYWQWLGSVGLERDDGRERAECLRIWYTPLLNFEARPFFLKFMNFFFFLSLGCHMPPGFPELHASLRGQPLAGRPRSSAWPIPRTSSSSITISASTTSPMFPHTTARLKNHNSHLKNFHLYTGHQHD